MTKTLYIHIGRPKVGSTAIQRFLKFNRERLLEQGILYPRTGERENASHLLAEAMSAEDVAAREALFTELVAEIDAADCQSAILSSENFYFVDPGQLAACFPERFQVKIVCYVRRQDEVLVSSYIQEMKDGSLEPEDEQNLDRYLGGKERLRLLDYKAMLDNWAAVFGEGNIVVRVFEKGQLKGNLFGDIMDVLGLYLDDDYRLPPQRVNPTPASDILALIKVINAYDEPKHFKRQLKSRLVEISEILDYDARFDAKQVFSAQRREKALAKFARSNAETARKYLGRSDGVLFREPVRDAPASPGAISADTYSLDRMAEIWIGMLVAQQKRINKLERQVRSIYTALNPPGDQD